jgi:hypothetical protein
MPDTKKGDRSAVMAGAIGVAGAVFGAVITGAFSYMGQKGDADAKIVELSLSILRSPPSEGTGPLREWAIEALAKHSHFKFDKEQQDALRKQALPYTASVALTNAIKSAINAGAIP